MRGGERKRENESAEYISDEGEGVDSICSAVLMLGHLELLRKILNTKFFQFHLHSSGRRHIHCFTHTYDYHCPYNDGLKCARVNAKLKCACVCVCVSVCVCVHVWVCIRERL